MNFCFHNSIKFSSGGRFFALLGFQMPAWAGYSSPLELGRGSGTITSSLTSVSCSRESGLRFCGRSKLSPFWVGSKSWQSLLSMEDACVYVRQLTPLITSHFHSETCWHQLSNTFGSTTISSDPISSHKLSSVRLGQQLDEWFSRVLFPLNQCPLMGAVLLQRLGLDEA